MPAPWRPCTCEVSPAAKRGRNGALNQVAICLGIVASIVAGLGAPCAPARVATHVRRGVGPDLLILTFKIPVAALALIREKTSVVVAAMGPPMPSVDGAFMIAEGLRASRVRNGNAGGVRGTSHESQATRHWGPI